jgi:class 3 adenylate cyclase/tetratricopeptide (TPR) repeat protein
MAERAEQLLVRKTVTVLFCDVTGFTSLGERMDPETMRRVMLRYFEEMRTVLERHGGTVEKFIGDAVMAIFGVPVVHEDDALRAVRAADEMRRALVRLNVEIEEQFGLRLEVRIGINTGEVVVGDPAAQQTIATGDAVNVAARLQQAAQPGEILLGRETHGLVADRVRAGPLETFSAKGKSEPVSSWRLDEVRSGAERIFRRLDSPLVGRDRERDFLRAVYRTTIEEQSCRLVTVLGLAGVGKTRLAQEVAARTFGATVAQGRCLSYGDGITFFPVAEIVRSLAGLAADDDESVVEARIAQVLPGGDEAALVTERLVGLLGAEAAVRSEEVFWAVRKLLEAVARSRPLVLVFEDLHWAEPTLLDLVEYIVGWSRGAPMLVLALARPDLLELRPSWPGERLSLEPLDGDEVQALLGNLLGAAELDPAIVARIEGAAEGNPLFVEELVRMLVDDGTLVVADGRWGVASDVGDLPIPPSISALLAARLDRLHPEEQTVLQAASVIGKQFWWSAVAELVPDDLRDRVGSHLHSLVRKRLVFPADSTSFANEDSFRFGHILVRDASYTGLSKALRADLHERFASWLDSRGGYEEIRGHHLAQAYLARIELGPRDEAAAALALRAGMLLESAGRRAVLREDIHAACNLLRRAMDLLPSDSQQRFDLMPELGSALVRAGEFSAAADVFDELQRRASANGDRTLELRAMVEQQFVRYFTHPQGSTDEIRRLTASVIPELEELGDSLGLAKAWWLASEVHTVACRWGERAAALERALEYAGHTDDTQQQATLTGHLALALVWGPTPVDEAISRCTGFYAQALGNRALEASCLSALATLRAMHGEIDEARNSWAQARAIYDELGHAYRRAARSLVPATVEMLANNPAAAEGELRWGYDKLAAMGEMGMRSTLAAYLAEALYAQGRLDEAEEFSEISALTAGSDDVVTQVVWRCTRAKTYAQRERIPEAARLAREAMTLAEPTDFPDLKAGAQVALSVVLMAEGRADDALPLVGRAQQILERKGNVVAARALSSLFPAYAG